MATSCMVVGTSTRDTDGNVDLSHLCTWLFIITCMIQHIVTNVTHYYLFCIVSKQFHIFQTPIDMGASWILSSINVSTLHVSNRNIMS